MKHVAAALGVVAAVVAAVLLNLTLLGSGSSSSDPVGKLSPKAPLVKAPPGVIHPETEPVEHDGADD